jgi:hypothetical protein
VAARQWRSAPLLSPVSLAILLLILEAAARTLRPRHPAWPLRRVEVYADGAFRPVDVWVTVGLTRSSPAGAGLEEYLPGLRFVYPDNPRGCFDRENGVEASINRWRLRGPGFPREKTPGTFRIPGLGDSFAFGGGVRRTEEACLAPFADTPLLPGNTWGTCRQSLEGAAALAREGNFRLALVIFPELCRLDGRYPFQGVHQRVRREAEALGIPVLDLPDVFQGKDPRDLWVHPSDRHPNEQAHLLADGALARIIHEFPGDWPQGGRLWASQQALSSGKEEWGSSSSV